VKQLYCIQIGATSAEGEKRQHLEVLIAVSDEIAYQRAFRKSHRAFPEKTGWRDHYARVSLPYSAMRIVKLLIEE
jgi:hypothetical protein